jgi:hypothetical protein
VRDAGSFGTPFAVSLSAGGAARDPEAADLDGDMDVALLRTGSPRRLAILRTDEASRRRTFTAPLGAERLSTIDWDGAGGLIRGSLHIRGGDPEFLGSRARTGNAL